MPSKGYRHSLNATTDAKNRYLAVVSQSCNEQFRQVAFLVYIAE